ncbi:MAG: hypothetical protein COA62_10305 [Rhodobiaceae bacterium]|nr:MAG: hypothetical protein COA62_10305 [Rhodobiaceae bacterium]
MMSVPDITLRPTSGDDLDFVLGAEGDPANSQFIGSWSREEHGEAISHSKYFHLLILQNQQPVGYLIAIDLQDQKQGVFLKRIVVSMKGKGVGRQAIVAFIESLTLMQPCNLWLAVDAENTRARRTYEALGFDEKPVLGDQRAQLDMAVGGFPESSLLMFKGLCPPD